MQYEWRGSFNNGEVNALHSMAFDTRLYSEAEWNWVSLTERHSLGWATARQQDHLSGFVNFLWDGLVHAWIQELMVAPDERGRRIGLGLIHAARDGATQAGCDYLHVDFDPRLKALYWNACGFEETAAGLMRLRG